MKKIAHSNFFMPCKNQGESLTPAVFAVNRYECFTKNNIETHQNFTGSYEKSIEVLNKLQDTQNIEM